jgi:UDP-glucuronate 4-epimerase
VNVIVTGSEGFIGRYLVKELSKSCNVLSLDKKTGINAIDINDIGMGVKNSIVFHLAAQTSVFNDNHNYIFKDNIYSLIEVVKFFNKNNNKLVFTSSSCAYNITSMYGISKDFGEKYISCYANNYTIIRLHNVYGKYSRKDTLFGKMLDNEKLIVYSCGKQKRHFTYIDDVVQSIIQISKTNLKVVNVANCKTNTVSEFCEQFLKYKNVDVCYVNKKRKFDKLYQKIDSKLPMFQYNYTNISTGILHSLRKNTI